MEILTGPTRSSLVGVSLSGCGRWAAGLRANHTAVVWDREAGRPAYRIDRTARTRAAGLAAVTGLAFHPAGLLAWNADGLRLIDPAAGNEVAVEPPRLVIGPTWSADGRRLFAVVRQAGDWQYGDLTGWEWDGASIRLAWQADWDMTLGRPPALDPAGERLAVRWSYYCVVGTWAAAGADRREIEVRDDATLLGWSAGGQLVFALPDHLLTLDPATCRVWSAGLRPGRGPTVGGAVSADGRQVLVARDRTVYLLDADPLTVRQQYTLPAEGKPQSLAFAPDGLTAACGTSKGEVVIWDLD